MDIYVTVKMHSCEAFLQLDHVCLGHKGCVYSILNREGREEHQFSLHTVQVKAQKMQADIQKGLESRKAKFRQVSTVDLTSDM